MESIYASESAYIKPNHIYIYMHISTFDKLTSEIISQKRGCPFREVPGCEYVMSVFVSSELGLQFVVDSHHGPS